MNRSASSISLPVPCSPFTTGGSSRLRPHWKQNSARCTFSCPQRGHLRVCRPTEKSSQETGFIFLIRILQNLCTGANNTFDLICKTLVLRLNAGYVFIPSPIVLYWVGSVTKP